MRYMLKFLNARLACGTYLWRRGVANVSIPTGTSARTMPGLEHEYTLVRVADLLRIHPASEEQHEGRHAHEEQARGKVRVYPHVRIFGIYLREDLVKNPLIRDAEPVDLEEDFTKQESDDEQQLHQEDCTDRIQVQRKYTQ